MGAAVAAVVVLACCCIALCLYRRRSQPAERSGKRPLRSAREDGNRLIQRKLSEEGDEEDEEDEEEGAMTGTPGLVIVGDDLLQQPKAPAEEEELYLE